MKNTLQNLFVLFSVVGASLVSIGSEDGKRDAPEYELPTYEFVDVVILPKPRSSPMPKVKRRLVGTALKLKFTVNEQGRSENVRLEKPLSSFSDVEKMTFAAQVVKLVAIWRFHPARDGDNKPVAVNVIMPVRVVKYGKVYKALASVSLDEGGQPD